MAEWKEIDFEDCPNCAEALEGYTDSDKEGCFYDGDPVRCLGDCGAELSMSCCSGDAWVTWKNEMEMED